MSDGRWNPYRPEQFPSRHMMEKSVYEMVLERRVARLEAENQMLRDRAGVYQASLTTPFEELAPMSMPQMRELHVVATWDHLCDPLTGQSHMLGRASTVEIIDGKEIEGHLKMSYMHESFRGVPRTAAAHRLEVLHQKVMHHMMEHWEKQP